MKAKVIKVGKFVAPFKAGPNDTLTLTLDKVEIDKTTGKSRVLSTQIVHQQGFTKTQLISCWAAISISGNIGYIIGDDVFYDECQAELNYQGLEEELKLTQHEYR